MASLAVVPKLPKLLRGLLRPYAQILIGRSLVSGFLLLAATALDLPTCLGGLAALLGAAVVVAGSLLDWPLVPTVIGGVLLCFVMRLVAIRRGWHLPIAAAHGGQVDG